MTGPYRQDCQETGGNPDNPAYALREKRTIFPPSSLISSDPLTRVTHKQDCQDLEKGARRALKRALNRWSFAYTRQYRAEVLEQREAEVRAAETALALVRGEAQP